MPVIYVPQGRAAILWKDHARNPENHTALCTDRFSMCSILIYRGEHAIVLIHADGKTNLAQVQALLTKAGKPSEGEGCFILHRKKGQLLANAILKYLSAFCLCKEYDIDDYEQGEGINCHSIYLKISDTIESSIDFNVKEDWIFHPEVRRFNTVHKIEQDAPPRPQAIQLCIFDSQAGWVKIPKEETQLVPEVEAWMKANNVPFPIFPYFLDYEHNFSLSPAQIFVQCLNHLNAISDSKYKALIDNIILSLSNDPEKDVMDIVRELYRHIQAADMQGALTCFSNHHEELKPYPPLLIQENLADDSHAHKPATLQP